MQNIRLSRIQTFSLDGNLKPLQMILTSNDQKEQSQENMEDEVFFPTELLKEICSQLSCIKMGIIVIEHDSFSVE